MSAEIKKYKARIFGELYVVVSDEHEEFVAQVVHKVDSIMKEIATKPMGTSDAKKVAVLAALKVAQELLALQQQSHQDQAQTEKIMMLLDKENISLF